MTYPRDVPPTDWPHFLDGIVSVPTAAGEPSGIYVRVGAEQLEGAKAEHVLVWHWHTPTADEPRWEAARCGLHTAVSLEPLHLEASLACVDGCPSHGWIRAGVWTPA